MDIHGNSFAAQLPTGKSSEKLTPIKLCNGEQELTEFSLTTFDPTQYASLADYFAQAINPLITGMDYKEQPLVITTSAGRYFYDNEQETLIKESNGQQTALGCGKIVVKAALKNASKTQPARIEIGVELTPDTQKDYEIIPFQTDAAANQAAIAAFMARYISKPFVYLENVVGVEINFNKVFYKPEKLRAVSEILGEIAALDAELQVLEAELAL